MGIQYSQTACAPREFHPYIYALGRIHSVHGPLTICGAGFPDDVRCRAISAITRFESIRIDP
jgi:hypothetical protein